MKISEYNRKNNEKNAVKEYMRDFPEIRVFHVFNGTKIAIGEVIVCYLDSGSYVDIDSNMKSSDYIEWKKGIGGIVLNDFKKGKIDRLFEFSTPYHNCLIRIVDDEFSDAIYKCGCLTFDSCDNTYAVVSTVSKDKSYEKRQSESVYIDSDDEFSDISIDDKCEAYDKNDVLF